MLGVLTVEAFNWRSMFACFSSVRCGGHGCSEVPSAGKTAIAHTTNPDLLKVSTVRSGQTAIAHTTDPDLLKFLIVRSGQTAIAHTTNPDL